MRKEGWRQSAENCGYEQPEHMDAEVCSDRSAIRFGESTCWAGAAAASGKLPPPHDPSSIGDHLHAFCSASCSVDAILLRSSNAHAILRHTSAHRRLRVHLPPAHHGHPSPPCGALLFHFPHFRAPYRRDMEIRRRNTIQPPTVATNNSVFLSFLTSPSTISIESPPPADCIFWRSSVQNETDLWGKKDFKYFSYSSSLLAQLYILPSSASLFNDWLPLDGTSMSAPFRISRHALDTHGVTFFILDALRSSFAR